MSDESMNYPQQVEALNRRAFLSRTGIGLGALALDSLGMFDQSVLASAARGAFKRAVSPKAKSVIFLHMVGAPSQLDLFEDKPELRRFDRKLAPKSFVEGKRFAFLRGHPKLLGSPYNFSRHGQSGAPFSELFPHLAKCSDDISFIRSMKTCLLYTSPSPRD